ncbi:hypothetical protein DDB_G0281365 [Dictyostelium discoideum AX4]|uniref:Putative uncharacterized protein DDB_G0281365 n=1 Tax=Dictyostelium discoideum TaxID=44689 RepID=Y4160_DICDI|nr:hypothetical protein DDB_G0281365 [Dictyostelium discoideum AX4]Q54U16.1 RecName: Full=Putative uncharacterized protein DDB_G0281365 [Dictyostelium discoideum]EAL66768.1 hypothetical protein DDB_G0281365 [Dictyostelium discoideum AX4]|eukprot:XP_640749.1 hypothetical protein DDB_G0281365 [Dictyostelium discoideum AX4]
MKIYVIWSFYVLATINKQDYLPKLEFIFHKICIMFKSYYKEYEFHIKP